MDLIDLSEAKLSKLQVELHRCRVLSGTFGNSKVYPHERLPRSVFGRGNSPLGGDEAQVSFQIESNLIFFSPIKREFAKGMHS